MRTKHITRLIAFVMGLAILVLLLAPMVLADGSSLPDPANHVVSTAGQSGINLFIINLYNNHRVLYALFVTVTMVVVGVIVAQSTEFVLRVTGLQRK